jgi:hypothetical protein
MAGAYCSQTEDTAKGGSVGQAPRTCITPLDWDGFGARA